MNDDKLIEAMRHAYKFGECAGPLQDPMELALAVAKGVIRDEVLEEVSTALKNFRSGVVDSGGGTAERVTADNAIFVVESMKGPKP